MCVGIGSLCWSVVSDVSGGSIIDARGEKRLRVGVGVVPPPPLGGDGGGVPWAVITWARGVVWSEMIGGWVMGVSEEREYMCLLMLWPVGSGCRVGSFVGSSPEVGL